MRTSTTLYSKALKKAKDLFEGPWSKVGGMQLLLTLAVLVTVVVGVGLAIYRGLENAVILEVDGETTNLYTFKKTVGDALAEAGINLNEHDVVEPGTDVTLRDDVVITVIRAVPHRVLADGHEVEIIAIPSTVDELLKRTAVAMGPNDRVVPSLDEWSDGSSPVRVFRVEEKEMVKNEPIPHRMERRDDMSLEKGMRRVVSRGRDGLERQRIKVTYEEGREVKRELVSQETIQEPQHQVVAYGALDQVSRGGATFRFKEAMMMEATAYSYSAGWTTARGIPPRVGVVAVDPGVIPLGSRVYVEGYGFATAYDTGGAIYGNRIDLFMETDAECNRWGRRMVKVYVIR